MPSALSGTGATPTHSGSASTHHSNALYKYHSDLHPASFPPSLGVLPYPAESWCHALCENAWSPSFHASSSLLSQWAPYIWRTDSLFLLFIFVTECSKFTGVIKHREKVFWSVSPNCILSGCRIQTDTKDQTDMQDFKMTKYNISEHRQN